MLELDSNIGKVIDEIRADAPDTIVIITADNGAWQDAWPDAGTVPFRGEKGSPFEGGYRVPGIMWAPGKIPAGARYGEMMSHIDLWATLATMVGLTPPPHGAWTDNDGKPIYFDSIDNSAYVMGAPRGSTSTARPFKALAPTSAMIQRTPTRTSLGKSFIPLRTPGSGHSRTLAPSARITISLWTRSRNTT
jgi:hypothetical protein